MIRAILACDDDWGIGKAGTLPWPHNSADLKWFKHFTMGTTMVMGRNTWNSLPVKPLPGRRHIVISKSEFTEFGPDVTRMYLEYFKKYYTMFGVRNYTIIGGAQLVESCLDIIDEFWLSHIAGSYNCDVFLPKELIMNQFKQIDVEATDTELNITKWVRR